MGLDQMQWDELAIRPNGFRPNGNVPLHFSQSTNNVGLLFIVLHLHTEGILALIGCAGYNDVMKTLLISVSHENIA